MNPKLYGILKTFMDAYDLYPKPIPGYQNIHINRFGIACDDNFNIRQPYSYHDEEHYDMLYVRDYKNKPHVIGVHQAVAKTFNPDYYPGCIVHHRDENKYHNWDSNLEILDRSNHAKIHHAKKYYPIKATCQVCGKSFIWSAESQQRYYSDLRRNINRIITCSRNCASYQGRMTQLGK